VESITNAVGAPKTVGGHEIYAIKLSDNVGTDEDEPNFLMVSNHHSRELVTPEVALYAAQQLVKLYNAGDADAKKVLTDNQVYIVYTMNPDGLKSVWGGNTWQRANARGVDLNRNYPIGWAPGYPKQYHGQCHGDSMVGSESYRGTSPLSEIETNMMAKWQVEKKFAKVMDVHSYGQNVRINYGCHPLPDSIHKHQAQLGTIVANGMGYPQGQSCCMGGDIHNAYNQHGSLSFLTELGGYAFQPGSQNRAQVIKETWPGFFAFFKLPISASGHVYSGTAASPGSPVPATYRILDVPCGANCQSKFTLGEKADTSTRGRYHIWLPDGTYSVEFTPKSGEKKIVQVTAKTSGNIQDIYLGESQSTINKIRALETHLEKQRVAHEKEVLQLDSSEAFQSHFPKESAPKGPLHPSRVGEEKESVQTTDKLSQPSQPKPTMLELACEQGLIKCDEMKKAAALEEAQLAQASKLK